MSEIILRFDIRCTRRAIQGTLAAAMVLAAAAELGSEAVTLTTYYPAPSGVYTQMITTGNAFLARDGGKVGIGTSSPAAKLDVAGNVKIADGTQGNGKVLTSDSNGLAAWQAPPSLPVKAPASCTPGRHAKGYGCTITVSVSGSYKVMCNTIAESHGECQGTWDGLFGYFQCESWRTGGVGFNVNIQNGSYYLRTIGKQTNNSGGSWSDRTCQAQ